MRLLKALCCAAAVVAFTVPAAHADEWNKLTYFTFSGPVQIPGATLPAGTYTFKIADVQGTRHIVQIFNKDRTKIIATLLAIPNDLGVDHWAEKPIVMFSETPAGQPAAVKAWFYPGMRIGDEFVYPKAQATKIAKAYHSRVLSTDADTMGNKDEWKNARVGRVDESGRMTDESNSNASASAQDSANGDRAADQAARTAPATGSHQTSATGTSAAVTHDQTERTVGTTTGSNNSRSDLRADRQQSRNGAVGTSGRAAQSRQDANAAPANRRARQLPKTASSFDVIALLGTLSFLGGITTARLRRRLAPSKA